MLHALYWMVCKNSKTKSKTNLICDRDIWAPRGPECKCLLFCHFKFCHDRKNHFRATQQRHLSHINAKERSDAIERLVSKGFSVQYNLEPFHSEQWLKNLSKTISVVWYFKMNSNVKAIWRPSDKRCHWFKGLSFLK